MSDNEAEAPSSVFNNFPLPSPMDVTGDILNNWKFFKLQWNDYEIATELNTKSEAIRMATLRSVMGKECLKIYQHLDITEENKKKVKESYIFGSSNQGQSERIEQYVARLRHLASTCDFGTLHDDLLRDRLVLGIHDKNVMAQDVP